MLLNVLFFRSLSDLLTAQTRYPLLLYIVRSSVLPSHSYPDSRVVSFPEYTDASQLPIFVGTRFVTIHCQHCHGNPRRMTNARLQRMLTNGGIHMPTGPSEAPCGACLRNCEVKFALMMLIKMHANKTLSVAIRHPTVRGFKTRARR